MSSFSLRGSIYRELKVPCVIYGGLESEILSVIHRNSAIFCTTHNKFYVDIFRSFIRAELVQLEDSKGEIKHWRIKREHRTRTFLDRSDLGQREEQSPGISVTAES